LIVFILRLFCFIRAGKWRETPAATSANDPKDRPYAAIAHGFGDACNQTQKQGETPKDQVRNSQPIPTGTQVPAASTKPPEEKLQKKSLSLGLAFHAARSCLGQLLE
jgi:hypothetical protein